MRTRPRVWHSCRNRRSGVVGRDRARPGAAGQAVHNRRIEFRIGVNLGDVIVQDGDLFGDGVNIAVRLEGLAEPSSVVVSGSVYEQVINKLDLRFDDLGPRRVKNIGEPVRAFGIRAATVDPVSSDATEPALALPDKPSIAVLPFDNISNDEDQEYFVDGITEDIIAEMSKISGLFVIARHSAFTFKGKSVIRSSSKSARSWGSVTCSKAVYARRATGCVSPHSLSIPQRIFTFGPNATTGI